jgi:hypothetical protein
MHSSLYSINLYNTQEKSINTTCLMTGIARMAIDHTPLLCGTGSCSVASQKSWVLSPRTPFSLLFALFSLLSALFSLLCCLTSFYNNVGGNLRYIVMTDGVLDTRVHPCLLTQHHTVAHNTIEHPTAPHSTTQHHTAPHSTDECPFARCMILCKPASAALLYTGLHYLRRAV